MPRNIYQYMMWANPKNYANTDEQLFYDLHSNLFNPATIEMNDNSSLFGLIRSDIILAGMLNKIRMDNYIEEYPEEILENPAIQEAMTRDLPFFTFSGERIYIPTYDEETNKLYIHNPLLLKSEKYAYLRKDAKANVVNPFEVYGRRPFSSLFTRLVPLSAQSLDSRAYYHPQFETIFIIMEDGTLENEIPIFDEKCKRVSQLRIFEDIEYVTDRYYRGTKEEFIDSMLERNLISKSFHDGIMKTAKKNERK